MHRLWLGAIGLSRSASAPLPSPVVMELFTAQGCAACPPAQAVANVLADRTDVILVTYWDAPGWRHRFGQPAFTERQRRYAIVGLRQLATPQVPANARIVITGRNREMARAIGRWSGGSGIIAATRMS